MSIPRCCSTRHIDLFVCARVGVQMCALKRVPLCDVTSYCVKLSSVCYLSTPCKFVWFVLLRNTNCVNLCGLFYGVQNSAL
jgi:hypothetical protein